jgi:serine/threonine-protein kinase
MTQDLKQPDHGENQGGSEKHAFCPPAPTQNGDGSTRPPLAPPAARSQRIDTLCNQFETKFQAGQGPLIEDFLMQAEADLREDLLGELLAIEVWHRRVAGQEPLLEDYLHRFPTDATAVRHFFVRGASPDACKRPVALEVPRLLGDYEIIEELGRGGMGVVYKARHQKLNRIVALKMILSGGHARQEDLVRFLAEAETVAGLQHANLVQLYEFGEHGNLPYFTLEYVAGGSLQAKLREGPLLPRDAAGIVEQLARGMQYAHQHGVVHRDLKPANILLSA